VGGRVRFSDTSTAAQATLVAEGGSNGGEGGRIEFLRQSVGGSARVILNAGSGAGAGGVLDISGVDSRLSVGSIEGSGRIALGARTLIVTGTGQPSTTFSGVIEGSTPPVFPSLAVLGGTLTLTGANPYSGRTSIGDGVNANSGKLVVANSSGSATGSGEVIIERGGTLAGSGFIAGPVTLRSGGVIAPGDPVTLTLRDSLVWDGGGVIRLVLGADDAGSDHLVTHQLIRGAAGSFVIDLVDAGFTPGGNYALLQFDQIQGFEADDFSVAGLDGSVWLGGGTLGFTAAVPEPPVVALLMAGLLVLRRWGKVATLRRHDHLHSSKLP
jgi:autotransporter-associated beta strand protein